MSFSAGRLQWTNSSSASRKPTSLYRHENQRTDTSLKLWDLARPLQAPRLTRQSSPDCSPRSTINDIAQKRWAIDDFNTQPIPNARAICASAAFISVDDTSVLLNSTSIGPFRSPITMDSPPTFLCIHTRVTALSFSF